MLTKNCCHIANATRLHVFFSGVARFEIFHQSVPGINIPHRRTRRHGVRFGYVGHKFFETYKHSRANWWLLSVVVV